MSRRLLAAGILVTICSTACGQTPDAVGQVSEVTLLDEISVLARALRTWQDFEQRITLTTPPPGQHKLRDVLEYFSDKFDMTFIVDDSAFEKRGIEDVEEQLVSLPILVNVTKREALQAILCQVNADYNIARDYVEIVPYRRWKFTDLWKSPPAPPKPQ